jgi:acetyl-CoA C-acetyltransferase
MTRAAGAALAREMVLTGRRMDAAEAYRRGLVSVMTSMGELPGATQAAAQELATKPKAAYALNKRWLARGLREEFAAAHAQSEAVQPLLAAD